MCRVQPPGKGRSDADYGTPPPAVTGTGARTVEVPVAPDVAAEELDDLTLVVRAQEGDTRSFEALVRRHQHQLYRLAVRLLDNRSDAEDAALPSRHGHARIDRVAAAGVLRHAVDQMTALRVRSCQIHLTEPSKIANTSGTVRSPTVRVTISVTARFGVDLLSATARVRQMIVTTAEDVLGLPVTAVDVDIVDAFADRVRRTR